MDRDCRPIDIHQKAVQFIDEGQSFVAALVLSAAGSTPQKAGARALIDAAGRIWGTLGGGWPEAEAQRRAAQACRSKQPVAIDLPLDHACQDDSGPICGGSMRILLDPTAAQHGQCHAAAAEALRQRRRGLLLTTLRTAVTTQVEMRWLPEEALAGQSDFPGSDALRSCLVQERPQLFADRAQDAQQLIELFVEPVLPRPLLLIAGGGHVGQALALPATQVGFDVTVFDDRPEFTSAALFAPGVTVRCGPIPEQIAAAAIGPDTYVVIVTRGHAHDTAALAACIHAPAAYIGMIGSRRKVGLMRESFLERGLATADELDRVFAPIGLDIGAVTVPEIAASIVAQLIAVRRKGHAPAFSRMVP